MKSKTDIVDFENSIGPWLGKTVKIVDYYINELFIENEIDLTKEQMIILKKLNDNDGLNQNELAFLTLRNKSSLTRLLVKMETKEYIIRRQSKEDKRVNHVYLTSEGRDLFKKTQPFIRGLLQTMEQDISIKEKQRMIKILKKIQYNFTSKIESL